MRLSIRAYQINTVDAFTYGSVNNLALDLTLFFSGLQVVICRSVAEKQNKTNELRGLLIA